MREIHTERAGMSPADEKPEIEIASNEKSTMEKKLKMGNVQEHEKTA